MRCSHFEWVGKEAGPYGLYDELVVAEKFLAATYSSAFSTLFSARP